MERHNALKDGYKVLRHSHDIVMDQGSNGSKGLICKALLSGRNEITDVPDLEISLYGR